MTESGPERMQVSAENHEPFIACVSDALSSKSQINGKSMATIEAVPVQLTRMKGLVNVRAGSARMGRSNSAVE